MAKVAQYMGLTVKEIKPMSKDFKPSRRTLKGQKFLITQSTVGIQPKHVLRAYMGLGFIVALYESVW